ncbi:MAG: nucleotidyltransferase [Chloroflexi bacterium]|nr:nucleotidyltransferase [Chloroflexota bacterium]
MGLSLPHHFDELLGNIEPPQRRRDAAATIPADVRRFIEDAADFPTIVPHSRLAGSYARHTALGPIKDVDFLVFVPHAESGERPAPADVLDDLYRTLDGLPLALGYGGRAQVLRRQRRSIHVAFDEEDFYLDVVPALLLDGLDQPLLVPDREWKEWVLSDPLGYAKALSALNAKTTDKAVPLIKLFKHWRTVQMQRRRPKGYWLEALVYQCLDEGWTTTDGKSYAELFTDLLTSIWDHFQAAYDGDGVPAIPDPMLGHDLAFNWERAAFETFMRRLKKSIDWAERALAKERDEIDDAIALWQQVFGTEYFTDSRAARMFQEADWIRVGGALVTGAGHITAARPAAERAIPVPHHRYYGDAR